MKTKTTDAISRANEALEFLNDLDSVILDSSTETIAMRVERLFDGLCPATGGVENIDLNSAPQRYVDGAVAQLLDSGECYMENVLHDENCPCGWWAGLSCDWNDNVIEGESFLEYVTKVIEAKFRHGNDPAPWADHFMLKLNALVFPDLYS